MKERLVYCQLSEGILWICGYTYWLVDLLRPYGIRQQHDQGHALSARAQWCSITAFYSLNIYSSGRLCEHHVLCLWAYGFVMMISPSHCFHCAIGVCLAACRTGIYDFSIQ